MPIQSPYRSPTYDMLRDYHMSIIAIIGVVSKMRNLSVVKCHTGSSNRGTYVDSYMQESAIREKFC